MTTFNMNTSEVRTFTAYGAAAVTPLSDNDLAQISAAAKIDLSIKKDPKGDVVFGAGYTFGGGTTVGGTVGTDGSMGVTVTIRI